MFDLLDRAVADRRLHRRHLEVYRVLLQELDTETLRPVKRAYLAKKCFPPGAEKLQLRNVTRALNALESLGYIERGPVVGRESGRGLVTYCLVNPIPVPVSPLTPVSPS